jgi:hypothetical protein
MCPLAIAAVKVAAAVVDMLAYDAGSSVSVISSCST